MADTQLPGNGQGDDKNRRPREEGKSSGKPENASVPLSAQPNIASTNAKRRRQRRKFSANLKKSGLELNASLKKPQNDKLPMRGKVTTNNKFPVNNKVQPNGGTPVKKERPENPRSREEMHPRPSMPREPVTQPRPAPVGDTFPATPRKDAETVRELQQKNDAKPVMEPPRELQKEPSTEPPKEQPAELQEPAPSVTYFSHPFSEEEKPVSGPEPETLPENEIKSGGEPEPEIEGQPEPEPEPQPEPEPELQPEPEPETLLPADEMISEDEPVQANALEEDDITIGKEESSPPIPVGRLKEEVKRDQLEVDKESVVDAEKAEPAIVSVIDVKKEREDEDKKEQLNEKESTGKVLKSWLLLNWPKFKDSIRNSLPGIGKQSGGLLSHLSIGRVVSCLALILVLAGGVYGYGQKWHESAYSYIGGLLTPKPVEKVEVTVNLAEQRKFGIITAAVFGGNGGSVNDLIPAQISMTLFFGELREPKVKGETGITALTFYGELKDGADVVNQFVAYMANLEDVQNLYKTDVYAMLDRTVERDKALLDYLDKLKQAKEKSTVLHTQIGINMDDFRKSYDSLTPDKSKYEQDFFTAMETLQAEKSDLLLKGFIDIIQKQAALKARISALQKLDGYYTSATLKLDKRIMAVEQNREALIQGIRVVDIPGADLNIIIKSGQ